MLRILYDDFDQKVKNIHDEMDLHHSYKKKACTSVCYLFSIDFYVFSYYYFYWFKKEKLFSVP